jgi:hypothetical protein
MNATNALTTNPLITWSIGRMAPRVKRMVYLSSLAAIMNDTQILDKEIALKLNSILQLANTGTSSLKLPIHLSKVIWSNKKILQHSFDSIKQSIISGSTYCDFKCIDEIINATPDWIKYDIDSKIREDISSLFCRENELVKV